MWWLGNGPFFPLVCFLCVRVCRCVCGWGGARVYVHAYKGRRRRRRDLPRRGQRRPGNTRKGKDNAGSQWCHDTRESQHPKARWDMGDSVGSSIGVPAARFRYSSPTWAGLHSKQPPDWTHLIQLGLCGQPPSMWTKGCRVVQPPHLRGLLPFIRPAAFSEGWGGTEEWVGPCCPTLYSPSVVVSRAMKGQGVPQDPTTGAQGQAKGPRAVGKWVGEDRRRVSMHLPPLFLLQGGANFRRGLGSRLPPEVRVPWKRQDYEERGTEPACGLLWLFLFSVVAVSFFCWCCLLLL